MEPNNKIIASPSERLKNAEKELELANTELQNDRLGGGPAFNDEGAPFTRLAGLNLPEVFVAIRADVLSVIDVFINDNEEVKKLDIQPDEKISLAGAITKRIHKEYDPGEQYYREDLLNGEFTGSPLHRENRFLDLYNSNYHKGEFRNYFKITLEDELRKLRSKNVREAYDNLSDDTKNTIDYWVNIIGGFPFEKIVDVILLTTESERKIILSKLEDVEMATQEERAPLAKEVIKYIGMQYQQQIASQKQGVEM